ncbi:MAG: hypothetical protein V8R19_18895 [Bacteroides uniformis]|jgi:hypothetical protein
MGFTTPCFIRKNKAELRKKLEELGYKNRNLYFYDCIGVVYDGFDCISQWMFGSIWDFADCIDCGVNEELFLAIASLRDDTNYMQWFVCTSDYKEYDGKEWKVGDFDLNTCPDDFDNILPHWRKATVNELIEHFK